MELTLTSKRVWEDNPILKRRESLHVPMKNVRASEHDRLVRFVHYFADPVDSPLAAERDIDFRKDRAIELAKVDADDMKEAIMEWPSEGKFGRALSVMISDYLKLTNDVKFETWLSLKIMYRRIMSHIRSPLDREDTDKSIKSRVASMSELGEIASRISLLEEELFSHKAINDSVTDTALEGGYTGWAEIFADEV